MKCRLSGGEVGGWVVFSGRLLIGAPQFSIRQLCSFNIHEHTILIRVFWTPSASSLFLWRPLSPPRIDSRVSPLTYFASPVCPHRCRCELLLIARLPSRRSDVSTFHRLDAPLFRFATVSMLHCYSPLLSRPSVVIRPAPVFDLLLSRRPSVVSAPVPVRFKLSAFSVSRIKSNVSRYRTSIYKYSSIVNNSLRNTQLSTLDIFFFSKLRNSWCL